jgi:hypothetical protein
VIINPYRYAAAAPAVTWNPSDIGSNITLSSGNLRATKNTNVGYSSGRATVAIAAGEDKEFRILCINRGGLPNSEILAGIADLAAPLNNYVGFSSGGWGKDSSDGFVYNNDASVLSAGFTFTAGDYVNIYVKRSANELRFALNGGTVTSAISLPSSGDLYPAFTVRQDAVDIVELNCTSASTYGLANGYTLITA